MLGQEPLFPPTWRRPVVHILGAMSYQLLGSCLRIWQLSDMAWGMISPWELIFVAGVYGEHSSSTVVHGMTNTGYARGLYASFCCCFVD
jgi:hypothetical protein